MSIQRRQNNIGYSIVVGDGKASDSIVAYSVLDGMGDKILLLFREKDDAERYAIMLNETEPHNYVDYSVIEIDVDVVRDACIGLGHKYTLIETDDLVVPPFVE